jgi:hypothetical protein
MYRSTFSWPRHYFEVSGQLHASAALHPGKSPRYPFYRKLGGPQSRSGRYGEVKIFYPTGTRTPAPHEGIISSERFYSIFNVNISKIPISSVLRILVLQQWSMGEYLRTVTQNGPVVPASDYRSVRFRSMGGMLIDRGNPCFSSTLSTTNSTRTILGSDPRWETGD